MRTQCTLRFCLSAVILTIAVSAAEANATPITFNFDTGANTNLGASYVYNNPFPGLTAFGGSRSGKTVTLSSDLYSNNGIGRMGLGICSNPRGNSNNCADSTGIDGTELVQLDLAALNANGYNSFGISADSTTGVEQMLVYASASSFDLGSLVATITGNESNFAIETNGDRYLNFVAATPGGANNVILHSLTADTPPIDEPGSLSLLCGGLVLLGLALQNRRGQIRRSSTHFARTRALPSACT